jgi:hypothetical protein
MFERPLAMLEKRALSAALIEASVAIGLTGGERGCIEKCDLFIEDRNVVRGRYIGVSARNPRSVQGRLIPHRASFFCTDRCASAPTRGCRAHDSLVALPLPMQT